MQKIPAEAFEYYVSLGPDRSYRAVADRFGVSKRAITRHAASNSWPERLERIEREARARSDQRIAESIEEMRSRHLKTLRAMSARALAALKDFPLTSGMEAIKAAEMTIKLERLIAGEPSSRASLTVEEVTRREIESLLVAESGEEEWEGEEDSSDEDQA